MSNKRCIKCKQEIGHAEGCGIIEPSDAYIESDKVTRVTEIPQPARPREIIEFETTWGRVKCHDETHVWFPRFFGEGVASKIDGRKTFVTLTFDEPLAFTDALKRAERAEAEVERLIKQLNCYCAYCDEQFNVGEASWDMLQSHIKKCKKHPVFKLQARVAELEDAFEEAIETLDAYPNDERDFTWDNNLKRLWSVLRNGGQS